MTIINYSDPSKSPIVVGDGETLPISEIILFGSGHTSYANDINQNLLRLLENFSTADNNVFVESVEGQMIFHQTKGTVSKLADGSSESVGVPYFQSVAPPVGSEHLWFDTSSQYTNVFVDGGWNSVASQYLELIGGTITGTVSQTADQYFDGSASIDTYSEYGIMSHQQDSAVLSGSMSSSTLALELESVFTIDSTAESGMVLLSESDSNGTGDVMLSGSTGNVSFRNLNIAFGSAWNIDFKSNSDLTLSADPTSAVRRDYFDSNIPPLTSNVFLKKDGSNVMSGLLVGTTLEVRDPIPTITSAHLSTKWQYRTEGTSEIDDTLMFGTADGLGNINPRLALSNASVDVKNGRVTSLASPSQGKDAANKIYVTDQANSIASGVDLDGQAFAAGYFKPDGSFVNIYNTLSATKLDNQHTRIDFETPLGEGFTPDVFLVAPLHRDQIIRGGTTAPRYYFAQVTETDNEWFTVRSRVDNVNTQYQHIYPYDDIVFEWRSSLAAINPADNVFFYFLVFQRAV